MSFAVALARVDAAHLATLTERERADVGERAVEKRRVEHASGRAAARAAVGRVMRAKGERSLAFHVVRRASGARLGEPVVVDDAGAVVGGLRVSVSHHAGLAVAAASATGAVGIDLSRADAAGSGGDDDDAFVREAFVDGELDAWRAAFPRDHRALTIARVFAAKEACAKLLGVGFALPLLGFRVSPAGVVEVVAGDVEGCAAGLRSVRLRVRAIGGGRVLAIARE